ncbi:MAG: hypothetical protein JNG84_11650 [Archangium sp.]|nr:hypothetical protein [Archangium sp.]
MHRFLLLAPALALLACDPARADDPDFAQIIGPGTNDFAGWAPTDCLCGILTIKGTGFVIDCSKPGKTGMFLNLPDLRGKGRVQLEGDRQLGALGPFVPAFFEAETGDGIKDARGSPFTGFWFPLRLYRSVIPQNLSCTGTEKCQSEADHTLGDSLFWCDVRGVSP